MGYPRRTGGAPECGPDLEPAKALGPRSKARKTTPRSPSPSRGDCLIPGHAYLAIHDGPFPLPEHLRGTPGELFRPGGADAGCFTPADQVEPAVGDPSRARSGSA